MSRTLAVSLTLVLLAPALSCKKTDPVAPNDATIVVSANPSSITLGNDSEGRSTISATVLDNKGQAQSGVGVSFATDSGRMESGGSRIRTDSSGTARDVLIASEDAVVTARSGSRSESVDVAVGGKNQPPKASFTINPNPARINAQVAFDGSSSTDPNGGATISKFIWTLTSDAATLPSALPECSGVTPRVCTFVGFSSFADSFPEVQNIIVQLQVEDNLGLRSNVSTHPVPLEIVRHLAPIAEAGPSVTTTRDANGVAAVFFDGSASRDQDSDGRVVRYDWNFGDGGIAFNRSTPQTNHAYTQAGQFTVTLTVWDNGNSTTQTCTAALTPPCAGSKTGTDNTIVKVN